MCLNGICSISIIFLFLNINIVRCQIQKPTRCFKTPGIAGQCTYFQSKWTFVRNFGCYAFQYSGCGGNQNNFVSKTECEQLCTGHGIKEVAMGLIKDGKKVTDVRHFPWFTFLNIGFPDIIWRVLDPNTGLITEETQNAFHNPCVVACSGILVTLKYILTADHCLWLKKPANMAFPGDESLLTKFISFYKNAVTDPRMGGPFNVAIKLFGTSYPRAHPTDGVAADGMVNPWWEPRGNSRAFRLKRYFPIEGGVNKDKTGLHTKNSVDLALLELVQSAVAAYFKPLDIDLTKELARLKWPAKNEELTGGSKIYLLGSGQTGDDEDKENNPDQELHISKGIFRKITKAQCIYKLPGIAFSYNDKWSMCTQGTDTVMTMPGDSGGPGLTKNTKGPKKKTKAEYFLQYISSFNTMENVVMNVLVGDKEKEIISL